MYLNGSQQKNPKWVDPNVTADDNINEVPLSRSVSPLKNRMMKINNFHRVVQSNNTIFAGL